MHDDLLIFTLTQKQIIHRTLYRIVVIIHISTYHFSFTTDILTLQGPFGSERNIQVIIIRCFFWGGGGRELLDYHVAAFP